MRYRNLLWLIPLAIHAQNALKIAAIPSDPLEMVNGPIQVVDTAAGRESIVQLLARARNNYDLRGGSHGYDLKVTFTVSSGGVTDYDGAWEMEDIFDPQQGLRWTAKAAAGYSTTQIASNDMFYGEATADTIPLRLHEARGALLDPMPSEASVDRDSIRMSTATFKGVELTCVLLSAPGNTLSPGRRWEETEECIDPLTGLLRVHSQVPGRYFAYEYGTAPQVDGYMFPQHVTVTEAGKVVSDISVESLSEFAADPGLFVPTEAMKARGQSVAMAGAQKISGFTGRRPSPEGATARPVVVFGLVTSAGQLVEAHSLQPSDPNSQAAIDAAKRMNFARPALLGVRPQQHFVFVIEKFISSQ